MFKTVSMAFVLTGALLAIVSSEAQAFHHHYNWWAAKYVGYGPCGCPGPYCFVPGCGSGPGCWSCCGVAYPVCTHQCCIKTWARALCLKHQAHRQARYNACCLISCGCCWCGCDGCSGGSCTSGGTDRGSNPEAVYDAPGSGAPAPEEVAPSEARSWRGVPYRLVSTSRSKQDGSAAFDRGLTAFRSNSFSNALSAFDIAAQAEPDNAMYQYYRALTLFDLNGAGAGSDALRQAISLEQQQPVSNWGRRMERVQGRTRVWVEDARRAAGLVH